MRLQTVGWGLSGKKQKDGLKACIQFFYRSRTYSLQLD